MFQFSSILLLSALAWSCTFANTLDDLLAKAENAGRAYRDMEAINLYKQVLEIDSNNYKALWNISFHYQRAGALEENDEKKKDLLTNSISYAKKTFQKYPNLYHANLLMAGSIARMSEFMTTRDRVHAAWDIQKYADKAMSLNKNDPQVWYLLAWLNFELSKPTWLERSLAKMLFGGLPPGSYEKAVQYLEKAIQLNSPSKMYLYDLATFYNHAGETEKAIELCRQSLNLNSSSPEDKLYHTKCSNLLARLSD